MPMKMILDSGQVYAGRAYTDALAATLSHGVPVVLDASGRQLRSSLLPV
jgi:hypothetical protein